MTFPDLSTFFGHFHPMVVHLPIGFLLLAAVFNGVSCFKRYKNLRNAVDITLLSGFISAIAACVSGYLLSLSGDYNAGTLSNHKYSGIALTLLSGVLWSLSSFYTTRPGLQSDRIRTALSLGVVVLLFYVGHQGSNLTHGPGYLSMETLTPVNRPKPSTPEGAFIFEDVVAGHPVNPSIPEKLDSSFINALRKNGFNVRIMSHRPVMLDLTLPSQSGIKLSDIEKQLDAVSKNIVWLNLSDNGFNDSDLSILKEMTNLEKLRLEKNPIGDAIVDQVKDLKYLNAINLNETKLTNEGLSALKRNPSLKSIYTWKTPAGQSD